jgi:antirestriction protein
MKQANTTRKSFFTISNMLTCERCLGLIPNNTTPGAYPGAISRTDDETEICSDCGTDEAYETFQKGNATEQSLWPYTSRIPFGDEGKTLDTLVEEAMNAHPHWEALDAFLDETGLTRLDIDFSMFESFFRGKWESFKDYVQDILEDCGLLDDLPDRLAPYFDIDRYAHDVEKEGMTFAIDADDGFVWVFDWP